VHRRTGIPYTQISGGPQELSTYKFFVRQLGELDYIQFMEDSCRNRSVGLGNLRINRDVEFQVMFPDNIEELVIRYCNDASSLCDVSSPIKYAASLECLNIWDCNGMESSVSSSWLCPASLPLPSYNGIFSGLKELCCVGCKSIKNLFPLVLLPNLVILEVISVSYCEKIEEIIGTRDEENSSSNDHSISEFVDLSKLRTLRLMDLPQLKSICCAKLACHSLEEIELKCCSELKRIPICLQLLDNRQPSPHSLKKIKVYKKKWLESVVEWEHPNAKDVLRPFVILEVPWL
jgi:disease resistance protein RPS2